MHKILIGNNTGYRRTFLITKERESDAILEACKQAISDGAKLPLIWMSTNLDGTFRLEDNQ